MSYPGNASLAENIRQRVLNTFRQTASLAEEGKREEALLGCEFILRLDPAFEPARALQDRMHAAAGAVDTADLLALLEGPTPAGEAWNLAEELTDLIARRELRSATNLAREHAERVAGDDELERLALIAQERLEAQPYVQSFLERAAALRQEGRNAEAEIQLAKARELDPTHPELDRAASVPAQPEAVPGPAREHDSDDRIERLLAEGQEAFTARRYQAAIDSWSRIFLIDIDHGEANRRIEEARSLKSEDERQVEELYHEAVSLWELGSLSKARNAFDRVLQRDPQHLAAREAVERIDRGESPDSPAPEAVVEPEHDEPETPTAAPPTRAPRPHAAAPQRERREPAAAPPAARRFPALPKPAFWVIGAVVLLGVLAAAWLLYSRRDGLFPNSGSAQMAAPADLLASARVLQGKGETAQAIARLRNVPSSHPQHAEAQALIAQWETLLEESGEAPSEEDLARRVGLVEAARGAAAEGRHLRTVDLLAEAADIAPLSTDESELATASEEQLAGIGPALDRFRQGDWEFALPELWRLHEADASNHVVRQLIVDCYYNLAVRDLQRRDLGPAAEKLAEGVTLAPEDSGIRRLLRLVDHYRNRELDLRYRIFVKYLPFR